MDFLSLNMGTSTVANIWVPVKINNRRAISVDPDETARFEPSYQDLHCSQMYLY